MKLFACGVVVVLIAVAGASVAQAQKPDAREVKARELFAIGKYAEALDVYGKLYAETTHPTYMRNIGRCYQNMGEPDKAISSFREYLRQVRELPADQRAQVEGYIREMEELKRKRETTATSPPTPAAAAQPPPPAPPVSGAAAPVVSAVPAPPSAVGVVQPPAISSPSPAAPAAPDTGTPHSGGGMGSRKIAGFIVGGISVGALVVGAVFGARAISKKSASDSLCPKGNNGVENCSQTGVDRNQEAQTAARVCDVAIGAGLVGGAVAAYLILSGGGGESKPPTNVARRIQLAPELGPGSARLVLGGSW